MVLLGTPRLIFLLWNLQYGLRGGGRKLSHGNFEVFLISKISLLRFLRDGGESFTSCLAGFFQPAVARQLMSVYLSSLVAIWDLKK